MLSDYNWETAFKNFLDSLQIMWKAMLSIFIVMLILFLAILLLSAISDKAAKRKAQAEAPAGDGPAEGR